MLWKIDTLRDSGDLLSAAFETTGAGICFIGADGRLMRFNPAFCRLLGRSAEELQGQEWHLAAPPETVAHYQNLLAEIMAGLPQDSGEWRIGRKDGASVTVQVEARAIVLGDGNRCAMLTLTNIEGRVVRQNAQLDEIERTGLALRLSEERYRQVVDHVSIGIIVVQDGRFRFANPMAVEITGYRLDEMIGREFVPMIHEADHAMVIDRHMRRQRGEEVEPRYEFRIVTPGGKVVWVELAAVLIVWDGAPATLSFVSDITKRKQAEEALRRSEGYYRSVIDGAPVGIVIVRSNRLRLANPRLLEMVGFSREEMLALPSFLECVHPEDREVMANVARRHLELGAGAEQVVNFRLRSKSGETVWVEGGTVQVEWEGSPATLAFLHDVTPQRRLEATLQRTLAERETILETSVMGIAFLDAKGRVRWANAAMQQIFDLKRALPVGESLEPYYPSREEYLRVGAAVSAAVVAGRAFDCELQMRREDGALLWTHLSGRAVSPHDLGQGTVWVVRDINRRKELEDELHRKTAEQEIILQSTQIGITHTRDRVHQWVNQTFASMLGYSVEELIGHSSRVHFPDEASWAALGQESYARMSAGESFAGERYFKRKNGEIFPVQMFGKSVDSRDPAKGAIWTVVDLTERRRLEDEVRRTSQEREVILQSTQIGITLSVDRRHRWINRTFADMMGFSEDELLDHSSRIHFPDEDSWATIGAAAYPVLARGEAYATECQMRRKNGELIWIQLFGRAVDAGDIGRGAIWTFVDVTQRHQAEEDIRRALAQQVELSALKTKFVSMTSHEFRTPLATILSSAELLRYYSDRLPEDERIEVIGSIEKAVARMTKMLDGILMIGRADSGNLELHPSVCRLHELCREIAGEAARTNSADGSNLQRLDMHFSGAEIELLLDEKLLRHILGNLIGNAFKYSPAGTRVTLTVRADPGEIVAIVADQGIGIPAEDLPRLFETFHRAANVGNISGTGLGLAIVKRAVELHGGKVDVDSTLGEGTRFTVRLPRLEI